MRNFIYEENIFTKILRGEIKSDFLYEDDYAVAFKDINPIAPVHIIVIPKVMVCDFSGLMRENDDIVVGFFRAVSSIINSCDLQDKGYRLVTNCGEYGCQEVMHMHMHILSGVELDAMA